MRARYATLLMSSGRAGAHMQAARINTVNEANGENRTEVGEMNNSTGTDSDPKACPVNDKWLRKMYEVFPPYIIRNSKLAGYAHCFEKTE